MADTRDLPLTGPPASRYALDRDDEARLVRESIRGNLTDFARLYEQYRPALYRLCVSRLKDHHLAQDAVQETFLRATKTIQRFQEGRNIWPWLATIAGRACIEICRRREHFVEGRATQDVFFGVNGEELDAAIGSDLRQADQTWETVVRRENYRRIAALLYNLPPRQRRAILLHCFDGWRYADIAAAEGVSVGAVKLLLLRARRKVRQLLEEKPLAVVTVSGNWIRTKLRRLSFLTRDLAKSANESFGTWLTPMTAAAAVLALSLPAYLPNAPAGAEQETSSGYEGIRAPIPTFDDEWPAEDRRTISGTSALNSDHAADGSTPWWESVPPSPARDAAEEIFDPAHDATPENTAFTSIAASPNYEEDHTIFAAGTCQWGPACYVLFVSRDGGATWKRLSDRSFVSEIVLIPPGYKDHGIYAVGPSGLQESRDGGRSYRIVSPVGTRQREDGPPGVAVSPKFQNGDPSLLLSSGELGGLFEYRADTGLTNVSTLPIAPILNHRTTTITFSPIEVSHPPLFLGSGSMQLGSYVPALYRCEKGSCGEVKLPLRLAGIPSIHVSPRVAQDRKVIISTSRDLLISDDWGKSLDTRVHLPFTIVLKFNVVWPLADDPVLYAVVKPGESLYRSADLGSTWRKLEVGLPAFAPGVGEIAVSPTGRIFAASRGLGLVSRGLGLACSPDGGITWGPRCPSES